eukprot:scaffold67092_cov39-Tisochrysis_lutea.AAC.2
MSMLQGHVGYILLVANQALSNGESSHSLCCSVLVSHGPGRDRVEASEKATPNTRVVSRIVEERICYALVFHTSARHCLLNNALRGA